MSARRNACTRARTLRCAAPRALAGRGARPAHWGPGCGLGSKAAVYVEGALGRLLRLPCTANASSWAQRAVQCSAGDGASKFRRAAPAAAVRPPRPRCARRPLPVPPRPAAPRRSKPRPSWTCEWMRGRTTSCWWSGGRGQVRSGQLGRGSSGRHLFLDAVGCSAVHRDAYGTWAPTASKGASHTGSGTVAFLGLAQSMGPGAGGR